MTSSKPLTDFNRVYPAIAFGGPFLCRQVLRIKFPDSTRQDWLYRSSSPKYPAAIHGNHRVQLTPGELIHGWDNGACYQTSKIEIQIFGRRQTWLSAPEYSIRLSTSHEQTELRIPALTRKEWTKVDESERIGLDGHIVIYRNLPVEVAICFTLFRDFHYDVS